MTDEPLLFRVLREALAEGEKFDNDMRMAGWHCTRNLYLRAFLELSASEFPEGSKFFVQGGKLFRGGDLLHRQHPDMPIKVMPYDDIWLPPIPEVVDELWSEVVQFSLEKPKAFRHAVKQILEGDLALDCYPAVCEA